MFRTSKGVALNSLALVSTLEQVFELLGAVIEVAGTAAVEMLYLGEPVGTAFHRS
jgi:hypothetical protein